MENRFLEMDDYLKGLSRENGNGSGRYPSAAKRMATSLSSVWAQPFSAQDRVLVILIENGGVDLGIPTLVDTLLSSIPGASLIPAAYRQQLVNYIREKIKGFTDNLLESLELSVNRYAA